MEHKIELYDTVKITDRIEEIKKDIDPVLAKLKRITIVSIVIPILLLIFCLYPFFIIKSELNYERILFASIGVLTFISIFYSLLISSHGREIIQKMNKLIQKKTEQIKNLGMSEVKESIDIDIMQSKLTKVQKQIKWIEWFKEIIDIEYLLIITVFFLLFPIILVIFNEVSYHDIAYLFFSVGFSLSGTIVFIWGGLGRLSAYLDIKEIA